MAVWFYAVANGRSPGIYPTWTQCKVQVDGFAGAIFRKFPLERDAVEFVENATLTASKKRPLATPEYSAAPPAKRARQTTDISRLIAWTDGACKNNGRPNATAGVGVYFGPNDTRNVSQRLMGPQTNQRAELTAALMCIQKVLENLETPILLDIHTDSMYLVKGMTVWRGRWSEQQWTNTRWRKVANKDLWVQLFQLCPNETAAIPAEQGSPLLCIQWTHVPAHSGVEGNEWADQLASAGCKLPLI